MPYNRRGRRSAGLASHASRPAAAGLRQPLRSEASGAPASARSPGASGAGSCRDGIGGGSGPRRLRHRRWLDPGHAPPPPPASRPPIRCWLPVGATMPWPSWKTGGVPWPHERTGEPLHNRSATSHPEVKRELVALRRQMGQIWLDTPETRCRPCREQLRPAVPQPVGQWLLREPPWRRRTGHYGGSWAVRAQHDRS